MNEARARVIGAGLAGSEAAWLWLVWDAHLHDQTPRAARDRRIEGYLKYALAAFYLGLGGLSLATGAPLPATWLATKALLFGVIFFAAIMIDVAFKPVGPLLVDLIRQGSSDATEVPLLRTMNRTRIWVWIVYLLLLADDDLVELFQQVVGEAGLDLQVQQAAFDVLRVIHGAIRTDSQECVSGRGGMFG